MQLSAGQTSPETRDGVCKDEWALNNVSKITILCELKEIWIKKVVLFVFFVLSAVNSETMCNA